jgi:hypothetical protein
LLITHGWRFTIIITTLSAVFVKYLRSDALFGITSPVCNLIGVYNS